MRIPNNSRIAPIAVEFNIADSSAANTSRDLETFAKHGGRTTINTSDVMLLSRRNEGLENVLQRTLDEIRARDGRAAPAEKKARGRPTGKGKAKQ